MTPSRFVQLAILGTGMAVFLVMGCGGAGSESNSAPKSDILSRTACKPLASQAAQECFQWSYDGQKLSILHVNAAQPCCPPERIVGWVQIFVTLPPQIEIQESMVQGGPPCPPCMCLYDLGYELKWEGPLTVTIRYVDPNLPAGEKVLEGTVDLKAGARGTICVPRTRYPWT